MYKLDRNYLLSILTHAIDRCSSDFFHNNYDISLKKRQFFFTNCYRKDKMVNTIRYFEMMVCDNSGQVCLCLHMLRVCVIADRDGKKSCVAFSCRNNFKLTAMIWLFTGFN